MQCWHQVKMDDKVYKAGFVQQKRQYLELLCAWCQALDSLTAALGEPQNRTACPLRCCRKREARAKCVRPFPCTTGTSKRAALTTCPPGREVCLTWVQSLQFTSLPVVRMWETQFLWVSFFLCVNDCEFGNSHQTGVLDEKNDPTVFC